MTPGKLFTHVQIMFYCYANVGYCWTVFTVFLANRQITNVKFSSSGRGVSPWPCLDQEAEVLGLGLGNEGQVLGLGLGF